MNQVKALCLTVIMCVSYSCQLSTASDMIWAASPSIADVRAAVSTAKAGDTVMVPGGFAFWGTDYLTIAKGISLIGAGINQTNISGFGPCFFMISPDAAAVASDSTIRVSGFMLNGNYVGGSRGSICIDQRNSSVMRNLIVDHIDFYQCVVGIVIKGNICGVAYSCHFEYTNPVAGARDCCVFLSALGNDRESWDDHYPDPASPYGRSDNFFIEDCTFEGNHWCEAGHGGRYVLRHNTFNNFNTIQAFDVHGNQPGPIYGTIISEIYENTFTNAQRAFEVFTLRGGYALCYNNVISGVPQAQRSWIKLRDEFDDNPAIWPVNKPSLELMRPRDNYSWGNRAMTVMFNFWETENVANKLAENVTYWNEKSPFDGSTGVGAGPLSSRPTTCTTGVAYWATDTNTLYRAMAPNKWSVYYTPYTYPHPLRNR